MKQAGGWTIVIEGQACYDRSSGVLVTMEYTKRWLFTGTTNGQTYERKYFGDNEGVSADPRRYEHPYERKVTHA